MDPISGAATASRVLNGDGPLSTSGSRIAAADFYHVEVIDEDGRQVASTTIDGAVGVAYATFPGSNGLVGLGYGRGGL